MNALRILEFIILELSSHLFESVDLLAKAHFTISIETFIETNLNHKHPTIGNWNVSGWAETIVEHLESGIMYYNFFTKYCFFKHNL